MTDIRISNSKQRTFVVPIQQKGVESQRGIRTRISSRETRNAFDRIRGNLAYFSKETAEPNGFISGERQSYEFRFMSGGSSDEAAIYP